MSSELLVKFCSPTLAGLKVANLFSCHYETEQQLHTQIKKYNHLLNKKGLYFQILRLKEGMALIYVYRKNKLEEILKQADIQEFLCTYGYETTLIANCIDILKSHLLYADFPHEIGVFLGYPLPDVKAFITNKGRGHKCLGCWKVYTNEKEAKELFCKFEKCTRIYNEKFQQGTEILKLAINL
ncbi:MAG: DUF3793 family protein [Bacillota bacterium]